MALRNQFLALFATQITLCKWFIRIISPLSPVIRVEERHCGSARRDYSARGNVLKGHGVSALGLRLPVLTITIYITMSRYYLMATKALTPGYSLLS